MDNKKFNDLKQSLINDGLPLGFHIWKDDKSNIFIIDGHHRQLALKALRNESYFIDKIPCTPVIAKTRKEAAKMLSVSLVTLFDWNRKNILQSYRIGNLVRYKKSDVFQALIKKNKF